MNNQQKRENERNIRSDNFLQTNKNDFAANAVIAGKIALLNTEVSQTQTRYEAQIAGDTNVRQDYDSLREAFQALIDEMQDIRRFARVMAREIPDMNERFRMPRGESKSQYLTAARVWAKDALVYKQSFLDYGIDPDFIDVLTEAADRLETMMAEAGISVGERAGATDALGEKVESASRIVESLDPAVRRVYRSNAAKLREWEYASKVEKHTPKPHPRKPE